ncbi:hypothetical protein PoB_002793400 [Plakobranchus ocellatus]|uniref:Uncharacterized protein n=1 Tax=Plakobranchus ocellatus TaxID=259542 RepID=A0AAV4A1D8_9GAST|nr:hypothetical protein PoB_002793400 [Plakobranchus ocellatus]
MTKHPVVAAAALSGGGWWDSGAAKAKPKDKICFYRLVSMLTDFKLGLNYQSLRWPAKTQNKASAAHITTMYLAMPGLCVRVSVRVEGRITNQYRTAELLGSSHDEQSQRERKREGEKKSFETRLGYRVSVGTRIQRSPLTRLATKRDETVTAVSTHRL